MAESSEGSIGSSRSTRKSQTILLDEFSSEEEVLPGPSGNSGKLPDPPKLKVEDRSKRVSGHASLFGAEAGSSPGVFSGAPDAQKNKAGQLSRTSLESSSSAGPMRSRDVLKQKKSGANDNDNDNDDKRTLLSNKEQGAAGRKASKTDSPATRKITPKNTGSTAVKSSTTITTTNTTTTTTTTTATTVPVYKNPSSSSISEDAEHGSAHKANGNRIADTKSKRRSYMASSVQPDQQSIAAVKKAESIPDLQPSEQKSGFEATLKMIEQMSADNRCAALVKLAPALSLFDAKDQAVYLTKLRKLASSPMPEQGRKKVIDALVSSSAGRRIGYSEDSDDSDNSGGEDSGIGPAYPSKDGENLKKFQQQTAQSKSKVQGINAPGKQFSKETIQKVLNDVAVSKDTCLQFQYATLFLEALNTYHEDDRKLVVTLLLEAFGAEVVIGALLLGSWAAKLQQSTATKFSPSTMLTGFIQSDEDVVDFLRDVIAKAAPANPFLYSFNRCLSDKKAVASTPAKNNPRIAGATLYLLMDMAALSHMPEASRCALITNLYFNDPQNLYDALSKAGKQDGETGFELAHRVIASMIDVSACAVLLADSTTKNNEHLASYQERVDVANGKKIQQRPQPRGKPLRELLLDATHNPATVKQAIQNILVSNADFEAKRVQLKALDTAPLTDNLPAYVETYYFTAANEYLNEIDPEKMYSLPDGERLRTEKKPYYQTLSLIHRKLPEEKVEELRNKTKEKYGEALNSTLPAVHAAIMNNHVQEVKAYLDAVLDPSNGLSSNQAMELIKMTHNGKSAFYRALIRGTPDMIRTFIETILASKLDKTHKIDLLLARRESDNLGAFYIAMSSREPDRVKAFIQMILKSELQPNEKKKLLQCKKELGKGAVAHRNKSSEIWNNAKLTARDEAVRNEEIWASREQKVTAFDRITYGARKIPSKINPDIRRDPAGLHNKEPMPSVVEVFDNLIKNTKLSDLIKDS